MSVPKLRFKEFDGNRDIYALEDQIDFLAGYAFDSKLMSWIEQRHLKVERG